MREYAFIAGINEAHLGSKKTLVTRRPAVAAPIQKQLCLAPTLSFLSRSSSSLNHIATNYVLIALPSLVLIALQLLIPFKAQIDAYPVEYTKRNLAEMSIYYHTPPSSPSRAYYPSGFPNYRSSRYYDDYGVGGGGYYPRKSPIFICCLKTNAFILCSSPIFSYESCFVFAISTCQIRFEQLQP